MLLILLVVSAQGAWAQSGDWKNFAASGPASGRGAQDDPFVIETPAQLAWMAYQVSNSSKISQGKYYILNADIDLDAHYWNPIGDGHGNNDNNYRFYGNFDGKGHTIKNMHLKWAPSVSYWTSVGLFGKIVGASATWACVTNLVIANSTIEKANGDITSNGFNIGFLVGELREYSEISNIIVKNSVNSVGGSCHMNADGIHAG